MSAKYFYQLSVEDKREIFSDVAKQKEIPVYAIEKDWWVVQCLNVIFSLPVGNHMVFKGGTSLSKAWQIIDRFSEDIDLAIDRTFLGFEEALSKSQIRKLRKTSNAFVSTTLFEKLQNAFINQGFSDVELVIENIDSKDQDPISIAVQYPSITETSAYIAPRVLLEIGARSMQEPFSMQPIQSLVGLQFKGKRFADESIQIPSVLPKRTLLEKLYLLHEEFQRPPEKIRVDRLSRHLYDIEKLAKTPHAKEALQDNHLQKQIIEHRKAFMRVGGVDYDSHYPPHLNPIPPDALLKKWERDYKAMQQDMIYGNSLPFKAMVKAVKEFVASYNDEKQKIT